jgi:hypothetical protein
MNKILVSFVCFVDRSEDKCVMMFRNAYGRTAGAPGVEDFGLCLTLDVFQSGAPGVEDFGLCLTLDVFQSGCP